MENIFKNFQVTLRSGKFSKRSLNVNIFKKSEVSFKNW